MKSIESATRTFTSMRCACVMSVFVLSVSAAHANSTVINNGNPNAASYYTSQAYGEIKNSSGNLLVDSGRFEDSSNPLGPASESNVLSASGSTLSFSTSARLDGFGLARAAASVSVTNAGANFGYNAVASQGYRTQAQFSSAATPGRVVFNFGLSGSQSTPYGVALGRLDFLARSFTPGSGSFFDVFGGGALHAVGAGTYSFTYVGSTASPLDILFYAAAGVVIQDGAIVPAGSNFSAFANFANTFDLQSIDLFDVNDAAITDWTLSDLATNTVVFNQFGRVTAPVPEPTTYALMVLGLAVLAVARRRFRSSE